MARTYIALITNKSEWMTRENNLRSKIEAILQNYQHVFNELTLGDSTYFIYNYYPLIQKYNYKAGSNDVWKGFIFKFNSPTERVGFKYHFSLPIGNKESSIFHTILASYLLEASEQRMKSINNYEQWVKLNKTQQRGKGITVYPKRQDLDTEYLKNIETFYKTIKIIEGYLYPEARIVPLPLSYEDVNPKIPYFGRRLADYKGLDVLVLKKSNNGKWLGFIYNDNFLRNGCGGKYKNLNMLHKGHYMNYKAGKLKILPQEFCYHIPSCYKLISGNNCFYYRLPDEEINAFANKFNFK